MNKQEMVVQLQWLRDKHPIISHDKDFTEPLEMAISALEHQLTNGWILVSENLPPQPKENSAFENKPLDLYLVSVRNGDYPFRAFWNGKIFTDGWGKFNVIAWQSLPEPYKEVL